MIYIRWAWQETRWQPAKRQPSLGRRMSPWSVLTKLIFERVLIIFDRILCHFCPFYDPFISSSEPPSGLVENRLFLFSLHPLLTRWDPLMTAESRWLWLVRTWSAPRNTPGTELYRCKLFMCNKCKCMKYINTNFFELDDTFGLIAQVF